jgi:hypothetical protein
MSLVAIARIPHPRLQDLNQHSEYNAIVGDQLPPSVNTRRLRFRFLYFQLE